MRIVVITTSRADYGIYQSLLKAMQADPAIHLGLVVSGTHLSRKHGYTVKAIEADGYTILARVPIVPETDDALAVSQAVGDGLSAFASVWANLSDELDLVVCLGDRYEMFAAVAATIAFNIPVAHLHGGETTLGAIDDTYRHAITSMARLHFTATNDYAARVAAIKGSWDGVYATGSPSMDGLAELPLPDLDSLRRQFGLDFSQPTILVTLHPETVNLDANESHVKEVCETLALLSGRYQVVITLPNADTLGALLRRYFEDLAQGNENIHTLESFGKMGYFAAMRYCSFLLGNTSSGLLEAPSFGKYAINIGQRQAGRARSANVIDVSARREDILAAVEMIEARDYRYEGDNVYVISDTAGADILKIIKTWKKGGEAGGHTINAQEKESSHE